MAPRQIRGIKRAKVSITNKILKIDNPSVVYQIKNIATLNDRLKEVPREANPQLKAAIDIIRSIGTSFKEAIIITIVCSLVALVIQIFFGKPEIFTIVLAPLLIVSCIIVIYKLIKKVNETIKIAQNSIDKNKLPNILYGVSISTNDGKSVTIYDYRKQARDNILSKISEVMENQDTPVSYVFQVEGDFGGDFIAGNKTIDVKGDYIE